MTDPEIKPWNDQPDSNWQQSVESWYWKKAESDDPSKSVYRIAGICPYCAHEMCQNEIIGIGFGLRPLDTWEREFWESEMPKTVFVSCNCNVVHAQGKKGCGMHAEIRFAGNISRS
jgi:hypothetical protein